MPRPSCTHIFFNQISWKHYRLSLESLTAQRTPEEFSKASTRSELAFLE